MRFVFKERKAAQAGAQLLKLHGGRMNYMVLIKLLYLADRQMLLDTGYPITGDKMVSMPHGPVLSRIYDSINARGLGEPGESTPWFEYVSEPQQRYNVSSVKPDPEADELSRYEMGILEAVHSTYGRMNRWALRDFMHTLPEWSDPQGSSKPIDPEDILRAAGRSQHEIERVVRDAEELWFMNQLERSAS